MSEILLVSATADVMFYEDSSKQWLRPGENGTLTSINNAGLLDAQKFSNVQLWQEGNRAFFRIIAKRIFDGRTLIEQTIFQKLKYQAATKCFHQWRNENRQVYGLSFTNEQDAEKFLSFVQNALDYIASSNGHYQSVNGANNVNGTGHYQEAIYYQQQVNESQHYKDADEDSLGSSNGIHSNAYRKSSYSTSVINGVGAMPSVSSNPMIQQQQLAQLQLNAANAIQRRASQGSNSSSSNSTNGVSANNVIYATSNVSNSGHPNMMGINRLNISVPPGTSHVQPSVAPTQGSSSMDIAPSSTCSSSSAISTTAPPAPPPPLSLTASSSGVPPISKNAPPPPPPPPPLLKAGNGSKPLSMVDSLKQTKLRNISTTASNGVNRTSNSNFTDSGIGSKTSTINSTTSGHVNLLSELEAKILKRNTNVEGKPSLADTSEKRSNGDSTQRPWQKLSNTTAAPSNIVNGTTDSPRIQRKTTSGASLCSQDEPKLLNNITTAAGGSIVTFVDFERFKQEMIIELNKAKQEILLAIRQEFAQLRVD